MDMALFIPRKEYVGPLAWLGRHDWLKWERLAGGVPIASPDTGILRQVTPEEVRRRGTGFMKRAASFLLDDAYHPLILLSFFIRSKILAGGPKLFRPTPEQCRAMENTEANIRFEDYRQPYPGLVIEWPEEYRREKERQGLTGSFPPFTLAYHVPEHRTLLTDIWWNDKNHIVSPLTEYRGGGEVAGRLSREEAEVAATRAERNYATLEEALQGAEDSGGTAGPVGPGSQLTRLVQRLTANFNLMLVTFGQKDAGPTDPRAHSRLVGKSHDRRDRRAAEEARAALSREVRVVQFAQEVQLFDTEGEAGSGGSEGVHASPKPHWRRGHIRRQHHGPGNSLVKLVFIKPVLVRRASFSGELSDTSVVYEAR